MILNVGDKALLNDQQVCTILKWVNGCEQSPIYYYVQLEDGTEDWAYDYELDRLVETNPKKILSKTTQKIYKRFLRFEQENQ